MPPKARRKHFKHKKDKDKGLQKKMKKALQFGDQGVSSLDSAQPVSESECSESPSRPPSVASSVAESVNLNFDDDSSFASPDPSVVSLSDVATPSPSPSTDPIHVASTPSSSADFRLGDIILPESPLLDSSSTASDFLTSPSTSRNDGYSPVELFKVPQLDATGHYSLKSLGRRNPLLQEVKVKVDLFLKENCFCMVQDDKINILFLSRTEDKMTQRQLIFKCDGSVTFKVHCVPFPINDHMKTVLPAKCLDSQSINYFVDRIAQVVNVVRQFEICIGVPDQEYVSIWPECKRGEIDKNPYKELRYSQTIRSLECSRLVRCPKWKCSACVELGRCVKRKAEMAAKEDVHPSTRNDALTEQQKLDKLEKQRKQISNARRQVARLRARELIKKEGVTIDEKMSTDFAAALQYLVSQQKLTELQKLFIDQQIMAATAKGPTGRRWHPCMIRFALSIYMRAPNALGAMINSGMLFLPGKRTLFDYKHFKPVEEGVDYVAIESVSKLIESLPKYQKYHVLMCDEMHISQNLVFNKTTGKVIGYVNISDVEVELEALQKYMENENQNDKSKPPPLASKVLTFLIKGIANSVKKAVASYAVHNLSKEQLYRWSWEVIGKLERAGIAVICLTMDGCSINRAFIKMHKPVTKDSDVIFDTINKAAPERVLYFIADVPHLVKTIRNSFASSSERRYYSKKTGKMMLRRRLEKNGEKILWSSIVDLYHHQRNKALRLTYKLNAQHVFLNGFSKMKVKYAAQVMSRSVAHHLEEWKGESKKETVEFIRRVNDFFDMLNGAHTEQAGRTLNHNLQAYCSEHDERFQKLEDFLTYLDEWRVDAESSAKNNNSRNISQVQNNVGDSFDLEEEEEREEEPDPASVRQLTRQTIEGIKMTVRSFTKAVKFLLSEGTKFINARIFCQDPLEQFFSKQRARGGGSTTPNFSQVINQSRGIALLGEMGSKRNYVGNTEELDSSMELSSEPLPKRRSLGRSSKP